MSALFTLTLLVKVTLLLLGALGLDQLLRRKSPLACAAMWNATLLALLAMPLLCLMMPPVEIPIALDREVVEAGPQWQPSGEDGATLSPDNLLMPAVVAEQSGATPGERAISAPARVSFTIPSLWQLVGAVYLAGVSIFALRLVQSLLAVRRLKRQAIDLRDAAWQRTLQDSLSQTGSRSKVRLMQSAEISVPVACGWLEPTIVIPADLIGSLSASARKGVLVHELVHLLRRDYPWQLFLRALQVVLWFHPLLWWAERRINFIRERVCDDFSIFVLGDSDVYCDTLLDIAARCHNRLSLSLGLAIVHTSRLARRLAALDASRGCRAWKASARSKGVLTILALAAAAAVSPLATKSAMLAEEPTEKLPQSAEAKAEPKQTIHPITVSGRALDSAGKPIEGATIYLISTNVVQQTLGETKTGRDGRYEFREAKLPVPKQAKGDFFKQGNFLVFGKAPDRAFSWRGMKTLCIDPRFVGPDGKLDAHQRETGYLPGEKIELDLTFAAPRPLTGRVVDEKGEPISKVQLRLANCDFLNTAGKETHHNYREFWGINQAEELMPEQFLAESDAEGKFQLSHVPPEMLVWLLLEHADYASASLYTATSDSPPAEHDGHPVEKLPLAIKLRGVRTVPVEVTFFDTGKPAKDVSVSAFEKRASGTYANGKSDEKGRVTLKLPPGRYKFLGDPPQDSDYIRTMQELVVEDSPASQPAALKLDSGCVLVLKAIDADTGKGVPGVSFWYEMDEPKGSRTGVQANTTYISHPKTNDKGELRAVVVPGKRHYGVGWSPLPEGYRVVDPADQTKGREVPCAAGEKVVVEFQVRGVPAAAPKKEEAKEAPKEKAKDAARPTIKQVITIRGTAEDEKGNALEGATVYVFAEDFGLGRESCRQIAKTQTKENGAYEFRDLAVEILALREGERRLEAAALEMLAVTKDHRFAWRGPLLVSANGDVQFKVSRGALTKEQLTGINFYFRPTKPIAGRVLDEEGKPIAGAAIRMVDCRRRVPDPMAKTPDLDSLNYSLGGKKQAVPDTVAVRKTDADGKFEFAAIPLDMGCVFIVNHLDHAMVYVGATNAEGDPAVVGGPEPLKFQRGNLKVTMRRAFAVPVEVKVMGTEKPAAGALVRGVEAMFGDMNSPAVGSEVTDEKGLAVLKLPAGKFTIDAGFAGTQYESPVEITVDKTPREKPVVIQVQGK